MLGDQLCEENDLFNTNEKQWNNSDLNYEASDISEEDIKNNIDQNNNTDEWEEKCHTEYIDFLIKEGHKSQARPLIIGSTIGIGISISIIAISTLLKITNIIEDSLSISIPVVVAAVSLITFLIAT